MQLTTSQACTILLQPDLPVAADGTFCSPSQGVQQRGGPGICLVLISLACRAVAARQGCWDCKCPTSHHAAVHQQCHGWWSLSGPEGCGYAPVFSRSDHGGYFIHNGQSEAQYMLAIIALCQLWRRTSYACAAVRSTLQGVFQHALCSATTVEPRGSHTQYPLTQRFSSTYLMPALTASCCFHCLCCLCVIATFPGITSLHAFM